MFTLSLNNEMTNVTGVMIPCHNPSQKPASSWVPAPATSFAPGAQAARTSPATTTPSASTAAVERLILPPSAWREGRDLAASRTWIRSEDPEQHRGQRSGDGDDGQGGGDRHPCGRAALVEVPFGVRTEPGPQEHPTQGVGAVLVRLREVRQPPVGRGELEVQTGQGGDGADDDHVIQDRAPATGRDTGPLPLEHMGHVLSAPSWGAGRPAVRAGRSTVGCPGAPG